MQGKEDRARFSVLLFWLAARMLAPGGKPKEIDLILSDYYAALADIRIERLEWAGKHLFATERWFPMPIDLRTAAMLAPSTVLPALPCNRVLLPELTEAQVAKNLEELNKLLASWDYETPPEFSASERVVMI